MTDVLICDWTNEVYVTPTGEPNQSRFIPFDEVLTNIERYAIELQLDVHAPARGSTEAYSMMEVLREALMKRATESGDIVVSDLCPQFIGLEGRIVRVVDMHGDERQVRVERWERKNDTPVHVEIRMGARTLAHREYETVEVLK